MKIVIVIAALVGLAMAETFDRPCRSAEQLGVKVGFLPDRFLGIWYEIERYEQFFQAGADCVVAEYTANPDGTINVFNRAFIIPENRHIDDLAIGRLSFPDEVPLRAMLNVTFQGGTINRSNYWILATDYFSYAFVVSCFNIPGNRSREAYWLLSRSRTITPTIRSRADELIEKHIDRQRIRPTNQNDVDCQRIPSRNNL